MNGCSRRVHIRCNGHSGAGFSLLELIVTTLIISAILALVSQILLQSYRLSAASIPAITRTGVELSEARLRNDVSLSRAVAQSLDLEWSTEPLLLRHRDAIITYALHEGFLVRSSLATDVEDPEIETQRLAPLDSFRWLSDGTPTVRIEWQARGALNTISSANSAVVSKVETGLFNNRRPVKRLVLTSRARSTRAW